MVFELKGCNTVVESYPEGLRFIFNWRWILEGHAGIGFEPILE